MNGCDVGIALVQGSSGGSTPLPPGQFSPVTLTNGDGTAITKGQLCYASADDTAKKAQSDGTEAEATCVYMCLDATIAPGATGNFVLGGVVAGAGAGHTFGTTGYLSGTPGAISNTPNLTAGQFNVLVGFWLNATDFQFAPQVPILN